MTANLQLTNFLACGVVKERGVDESFTSFSSEDRIAVLTWSRYDSKNPPGRLHGRRCVNLGREANCLPSEDVVIVQSKIFWSVCRGMIGKLTMMTVRCVVVT